jgi:hypothetical protein
MASEGTPPIKSSKLLDLPIEIRIEILYYALLCPILSANSYDDAAKVCLGLSDFGTPPVVDRNPKERSCYYWGTERMTRLLRVNHQLHAEAEEVLYSSFVFCFPPDMSPRSLSSFIAGRSRRSLKLIRHIELSLHLVLKERSWWNPPVAFQLYAFTYLLQQWEMCKVILAELPGLKTVKLQLSSAGGPQPTTPKERGSLVNLVVRLMGMFRSVQRLELIQKVEPSSYWSELAQECIDRFWTTDCVG